MKILLISRCPPYPLHFGDRLIIWHLARQLSQRGHQLDLLALTQYNSDMLEMSHYALFFNDVQLFLERPRTQWMYLKRLFGYHYPQTQNSAWQPDLWQAIESKIAEQSYDVVQLFGGVHVYEFATLLRDIPTIITPYESYSLYLKRAFQQSRNLSTWLSRQIARQFEQWMFALYDTTVVLSEEDRQELLSINQSLTIRVIPNGIELSAFAPQERVRERATLLFVGNFDYPPNHDAAMLLVNHIFPQILADVPHAQLFLVGNAPSDEMQHYASDNIIITGRVPSVQDYLSQATIFVCPLRVGAGIKNKVLEALAMQIPTIATPLSFEGIAIEDGVHAQIATVEEMAMMVVNLLNDTTQQRKLSSNSRKLIDENYSWQGVADRYEALYSNLVKRKQHSRE